MLRCRQQLHNFPQILVVGLCFFVLNFQPRSAPATRFVFPRTTVLHAYFTQIRSALCPSLFISLGLGLGLLKIISVVLVFLQNDGDTANSESSLLASALVMSDGAPSEEQEASANRAAKRLSLRRETVLQWLHQTTTAGDGVRADELVSVVLPF